jgi:uncharacterized protein (DUF2336 family)
MRQRILRTVYYFDTPGWRSLSGDALMLKGFTVFVVALISTAQVDQYLTHGRYTDAAMAMLRQIGRAFGF